MLSTIVIWSASPPASSWTLSNPGPLHSTQTTLAKVYNDCFIAKVQTSISSSSSLTGQLLLTPLTMLCFLKVWSPLPCMTVLSLFSYLSDHSFSAGALLCELEGFDLQDCQAFSQHNILYKKTLFRECSSNPCTLHTHMIWGVNRERCVEEIKMKSRARH